MSMIENMRALIMIARRGSFVAAAEALDLSPSVLTKRVMQLEAAVNARLLDRTTRSVGLTADGEYHLKRMTDAVNLHDEAVAAMRKGAAQLEGTIRIKLPTTQGFLHLSGLVQQFVEAHPSLNVEVLLMDGPFNPTIEGFDIAISAFPLSFDGVVDTFLWPVRRTLIASPGYLESHGRPENPRQLQSHDCLVYQPTGANWPFMGPEGRISVPVRARISSNDMLLLLNGAKGGLGIGMISRYVSSAAIAAGEVVEILEGYAVPDLWIKAMVPSERAMVPRVQHLLEFFRERAPLFGRDC
ncbi:LysR family transcriptional regulator [Bosea sp. LjRoot90]|uniref:LysR family transcriptional regulator n=1 Tax=Bosea sp. LjRoot90 TaxID=3342342 RepID=UPI003ECFAADF